MRRIGPPLSLALPFALAALASSGAALAQGAGRGSPWGDIVAPAPAPNSSAASGDVPSSSIDAPNERRAGLVVGFGLGLGLAGSSGYPNNATNIGDPNYYSASDVMIGRGLDVFVMGALTDYLNFGVWAGTQTFDSGHWHSTGGGGGFRVEAFPLYRLVPALADLAAYTQLGVGTTTLHNKLPGNYPTADGAQSFLGVGILYDITLFHMLGGHVALSPSVEYDVITSRSVERHGLLVGARVALYFSK